MPRRRVDWLPSPSLEAAHAFLEGQLPGLLLARRTLLVVGRCRVEYEGRAVSRLGEGDRIVLVKADGTLLVHTPTGLKPVNWQPGGGALRMDRADGRVVLEARRARPVEVVRLTFDRFDLVGVALLDAGAPLEVGGTEFEIRDALRARPELVEAGFVPWERERLTERGPMDLYGEDAKGRRVVVEVKRIHAGIAEATQLWRYVEKERTKRGVEVRGILVAPSVSERAQLLLAEHGLEFRTVSVEALTGRGHGRKATTTLLAFHGADSAPH